MLAMRAALVVLAKPVPGPDSRLGSDAMISRTPALENVTFKMREVQRQVGHCPPQPAVLLLQLLPDPR